LYVLRDSAELASRRTGISLAVREGMSHALYEVWFSRGEGFQCSAKFRLLDDARRHVAAHVGEASYAIRDPQGRWETFKRVLPVARSLRVARGTRP
jgi:hypothetical protein